MAKSCFEISVVLGFLFLLKINWRTVFDKLCCFGDLQLGLVI